MNEAYTINRGVLLPVGRKAYYDWVNSLGAAFKLDEQNDVDKSGYLISDDLNHEEAIDQYWEYIFESELFSITTDENEWPENRTKELFLEFFRCQFCSFLLDLEEGEILREEV